MNKIVEVVGSILVGAVVATGSALEKGCEVVSSAACDAGKIVTNIADGIATAGEDKSKNNNIGKR